MTKQHVGNKFNKKARYSEAFQYLRSVKLRGLRVIVKGGRVNTHQLAICSSNRFRAIPNLLIVGAIKPPVDVQYLVGCSAYSQFQCHGLY